MPIKINALTVDAEDKPLAIAFGDETLNLVYRTDRVTPLTESRMMQMASEQRNGAALVEFIGSVVATWDLQRDDGTPYPLTAEALFELPIVALNQIVTAITEAQRPNRKSGKRSGAG